MDIELEDNKLFISNIPRISYRKVEGISFHKPTKCTFEIRIGLYDEEYVIIFYIFKLCENKALV